VGNTSGETGHQEDSGDLDDIIIHQVSITQGTPSPDQECQEIQGWMQIQISQLLHHDS
jgi:hypothetical protein